LLNTALKPIFFSLVLLQLFGVATSHSYAQNQKQYWQLLHIPQTAKAESAVIRAKTLANDTLQLPFWDDFSYVNSNSLGNNRYAPDSMLWASGSETVRVNTGLNINPPTIGIATFDGVDKDGRPYSSSENAEGLADSLVSLPINLASVPNNQRQSVYFSFFWQQFGLGEFPDAVDSIRLQFKNVDNEWVTQWRQSGGDSISTIEFTQEMIQIVNPNFYHNAFQFRFQSFNRLSGAFDTWNIDYIYLNSGRTASNTAYLDRALSTLPTSPFGDYTAIPYDHFKASLQSYVSNSSVDFYNLNIQLQPVRFTALLKDHQTKEVLQVLTNNQSLNPVPAGQERRTITAEATEPTTLIKEQDSLYVETEFFITSGDNFLIENIQSGDTTFSTNVDFRVNDTTRAIYALHDYYAYDDGEAEFGVEVNQSGGKVAYQFVSPKKDLLTHVDVYFPPIIRNQSAIPFQLMIWKSLEDSLGQEVVLREQQSQTVSGDLNQLVSIELSSPVVVSDTFYIGYEQQGDSFIAIGFDKNTDTSEKIFFNVTGAWDQDTELKGSLMMRPRFEERQITGIDEPDNITSVIVYPNPSDGSFTINTPFEAVYIYDIRGKLLQQFVSHQKKEQKIETELSRGIYLLKIVIDGKTLTKKLLIK